MFRVYICIILVANFCNIEAHGGVIQLSDLIKNIFICAAKMNESLTGLNNMRESTVITDRVYIFG